MQTESYVSTASGALYLRKLCRHFAHKVPVTLSEQNGLIEFPFGRCRLEVLADQLRICIHLTNPREVEVAEDVVARHLLRMAPQEELTVAWERRR